MLSSPRLAVNHPRAQPCQPAWLRWAEGCRLPWAGAWIKWFHNKDSLPPGEVPGGCVLQVTRETSLGLHAGGHSRDRGVLLAAKCLLAPLGSSWILLVPLGSSWLQPGLEGLAVDSEGGG